MVDNTNKDHTRNIYIYTGIVKNHNRRTIGAGELSKDCHKSLNIKEGVSYFPFDYTMCKFITDLFFTNVGLVLTGLFTSEADYSFQELHRKENV